MIISNQRYFVCLESFSFAIPAEYDSSNAFITTAYYDTLTYNARFYSPYPNNATFYSPYPTIAQFTAGRIYQIHQSSNGDIITYEDYAKEFNITKNNCESKFLEVKMDLTEKEMKAITNLETKGYVISFSPIACIIDENGYNPSIATFCVHVSNFKIYPIGLTEYASDIMTGLSRAIKRYRSKSKGFKYLESAIHGQYYEFVKNIFLKII